MRVLILHSPVLRNARPDDLETLAQVDAVTGALNRLGHSVTSAPFHSDRERLAEVIWKAQPALLFNLVETFWDRTAFAPFALEIMEGTGLPITGAYALCMRATGDKLQAKTVMTHAGLPTPHWAEGPSWRGLDARKKWIVKCADEDASLGLDDEAIVVGRDAVSARAESCTERYGGTWFAEEFIKGREFNVGILERSGLPEILPIAEMRFERWNPERPKFVGYNAKWDESDEDFANTVRSFDWSENEPDLNATLAKLAKNCWNLFACRGYARVDIRVDESGTPYILEINANPSLEPEAGFAVAANQSGLSYDKLIENICRIAIGAAPQELSRDRNAR